MSFKKTWLLLRVIVITIVICIGVPEGIRAENQPLSLTLEEAIHRALGENNILRAQSFDVKRAEWNRKNAWTQLLPSASFNSRMMRIDDRTFAERDFRRYLPPALRDQIPQTVFQTSYFSSIDVTLPIFNSQIINGLSIANKSVQAARSSRRSTLNNTLFMTVQTYLSVAKAKDMLDLQNEYLELAKLNLEKAQRMANAERYSRTDLLRYQMDFQQQESILVNTESGLRSSVAALKRMINSPFDRDLEIDGEIPQELAAECNRVAAMSDQDIVQLIQISDDQLIQVNSALTAAKSSEKLSGLVYRGVLMSWLPTVSLSYSHGWRENDTPDLDDYSPKTLMVNLSVPIFTSFQKATSARSSYYEYRAQQERFMDNLQNTRLLLTEVANRLIQLKAQKNLTDTAVEYNSQNFNILEQKKDLGLVSHIEFLDAKLDLQNAKSQSLQNHYDFITTVVELYYLLNKMDALVQY